MTATQFIEKFKAIAGPRWEITDHGTLRKFTRSGCCYCPITWVAMRKGFRFGFSLTHYYWRGAAAMLGIPESEAGKIVKASDLEVGVPKELAELRHKLLEAALKP